MRLLLLGYPGHMLLDTGHLDTAAARLGVTLQTATPDDLTVDIGATTRLLCHGKPLEVDVIIPRGTSVVGPFLTAALNIAEASGIRVVNSPAATRVCEDKLLTAMALARNGVPQLPTTGVLPGGASPGQGGRVYLKAAWQSRGRGVTAHPDSQTLAERLTELRSAPLSGPLVEHLVVQPAATGAGTDYRVLVADGDVLAVIERQALNGSHVTSELASARRLVPPGQLREAELLGVHAAEAVGAVFAGVDVIEHDGCMTVIEVNASPGLLYAERVTGQCLEVDLLRTAIAAR